MQQKCSNNEKVMNCVAALGSRTPFASPYGEQRGGITLIWIPWPGVTSQGACLRYLHQGSMWLWAEELARGACWLLLCHQEYENTVTGMESELILCCHQQPHPSASHILSPSQCSLCLSITHSINEPVSTKPVSTKPLLDSSS